MSNFKSGSGNLDFGSDGDEDQTTEHEAETDQQPVDTNDASQSTGDRSESGEQQADQSATHGEAEAESQGADTDAATYPYFVRRSKVTDERDVRLELHVREEVANGEAAYRNDLAAALGTSDVSKTDAREFALKFAFEHPEQVAELMRDEGFGAI